MAHHYKHGRTSQETESQGLQAAIDQNVLVVRSQVLDLLSTTVSQITPDKLENRNAQELSSIARNLSSIMSSTRPLVNVEQTNNAQVIVFSPEAEKETTSFTGARCPATQYRSETSERTTRFFSISRRVLMGLKL